MEKTLIISLILVYLTSFIDAFGQSMIIPILPKYTNFFASNTIEYGICFASYAVSQFFSYIIMGKLSDIYGRKLLLLISLFGSTTGPFIQALCSNIWTFTAARFYTGCLGGSSTISYAYISDSIDVKSRPKYQSKICGMVCIAYVVGPLVGSALVNIHLRLPLWISGSFAGIVFVLSIFYMKDSKYFINERKEKEAKMNIKLPETSKNEEEIEIKEEKKKKEKKSLKIQIEEPLNKDLTDKNKKIQQDYLYDNFWIIYILLIVMCFLVSANMTVLDVIYPLMADNDYRLSSMISGLIYAMSSLEYALFQMYLFQKMRKYFGLVTMYFIAFPFSIIGDLIISFSKTLWLFIVGIFLHCVGGAMIACHHTIITSLIANPESGGKYLGYLMSDDGLARIVLPLIITPIYNKNHGLTFQIGALFFVIGLVIAILLYYQTKDIKVVKKLIKK